MMTVGDLVKALKEQDQAAPAIMKAYGWAAPVTNIYHSPPNKRRRKSVCVIEFDSQYEK